MFVRPQCEACTGDTQVQCNAISADFRELAGSLIKDMANAEDPTDPIFQLETQQRAQERAPEFADRYKNIGCQLTDVQFMMAMGSELIAGITLAAGDIEEAEEAEEAAHIERLERLTQEGLEAAREARELIETVKAEVAQDQETATIAYCQEQGWDIDNLNFAQRMDIKTHLREQGWL